MCSVAEVKQAFDAWLISVRGIDLIPLDYCVDGCESEECKTPDEHLDHAMAVHIDIPVCFANCKISCDCWEAIWDDLGWVFPDGPTVVTRLGMDGINDLDVDMLEDHSRIIRYHPTSCAFKLALADSSAPTAPEPLVPGFISRTT